MKEPVSLRQALRRVPRKCRNVAFRYPDKRRAYRELSRVSPNPTTFNEKVLWKMAFDRDPQLTLNSDKVGVRDFVAERVGAEHLTDCYGVYERGRDIDWESLPRQFAIKGSHGCGALVLVWEGAERRPFPGRWQRARWDYAVVHPDDLVRPAMSRMCDGWLRLRYEWGPGRLPEWSYRGVRPRILIEELLTRPDGRLPDDYSFFMFDGKCRLVQMNYSRFAGHRRDLFDADWNLLPCRRTYPPPEVHGPRPDTLEEMLAVSEALSRDIDFVRVDLFSIEGRVVFSELTNCPDAGLGPFEPDDLNHTLGAAWTLPR